MAVDDLEDNYDQEDDLDYVQVEDASEDDGVSEVEDKDQGRKPSKVKVTLRPSRSLPHSHHPLIPAV
jgi:hypothetical protein